jgi:hypothetical protein
MNRECADDGSAEGTSSRNGEDDINSRCNLEVEAIGFVDRIIKIGKKKSKDFWVEQLGG